MDGVTKWVARGNTYPPDARGQQSFDKAIALLQEYIEQMAKRRTRAELHPNRQPC
jgi:hypothetical protein